MANPFTLTPSPLVLTSSGYHIRGTGLPELPEDLLDAKCSRIFIEFTSPPGVSELTGQDLDNAKNHATIKIDFEAKVGGIHAGAHIDMQPSYEGGRAPSSNCGVLELHLGIS
ncbi:hypothetical protein FQN57_006059 [Myotisia sp. PD_48]|nr:hypothetical protein FQN57_006059 [Myotisia sp. PD_48]